LPIEFGSSGGSKDFCLFSLLFLENPLLKFYFLLPDDSGPPFSFDKGLVLSLLFSPIQPFFDELVFSSLKFSFLKDLVSSKFLLFTYTLNFSDLSGFDFPSLSDSLDLNRFSVI
jgi:hypothetical protein